METRNTQKPVKRAADKKPYQRPKVFSYGNVREITRAVGNNGLMDAATGSVKTQP